MQIVHLLAGDSGACDEIVGAKVGEFIAALTSQFEANHNDLLTDIREVATFKKNDLKERTIAAIKEFRSTWS
jgi:F0F1-type ATP synthase alpha subunit